MEKSRHHRVPHSKGGSNHPPNTIKVPHHLHVAYHVLFGTMTPQEIAEELNSRWIDPKYKFLVVPQAPEPNY